jgi:DNA-binding MarR family transcriptional regulator
MEELNRGIEISKLISETAMLLRNNMMKGFEGIGITAPQGMVIGTLSKLGQVKISDLSERLSLSNSTISGIVDRLEKQHFVERIRSEEDRRVVYVKLTPKFQEMHKGFHLKAEKNIENIIAKARPEEINKIIEGLDALKRLLERENKQ